MSRQHSSRELLSVLLGTLLSCVFFGACFGGGGGHGGGGGGGGGGGANQIINLNVATSQSGPNLTLTDNTNASFGVVVSNIGALPSDQLVTVTVSLPTGITFVSYASTTPGWTCTATGQTVSCTSSASIAGLTGTSTLTLTVSVATSTLGMVAMGLTVSTPDGTPSTHSFTANVIIAAPVPTLTSISPSSTILGGPGFTLTVNGTNFFTGNSQVQWNGSGRTTTFVSSTQLTASITASDILTSGTVSITVVNAAPGGGTSNALTFTIDQPVPTLTAISPTSATVNGPAFTLAVNGTNFTQNSQVQWNGSGRATTYLNDLQLTAAILTSDLVTTAGSASITVVNPTPGGGTSNAMTFTINATNPVPVITSLNPSSANAGGTAFPLNLQGSGFVMGSQVQWNGSNRATTYLASTSITAAITASDIATQGSAQVIVVNPAPGGGTSNAMTFTINPAPVISVTLTQPSFSPVIVATSASVTPFIASVANGSGAGVQWAVNGTVGGNSTLGTISPAQAASGQAVTYTAPASVPTPSSVSITAVYAGNTSIVSQAVTVNIVPNHNSLLNGPFAFQLRSYQSSLGTLGIIGTFTADGAGTLSSVFIDISNGNAVSSPFSGWYAMDSATHGTIQLTENADPNAYMSLSVELDQGGQQGFLIETDGAIYIYNSGVFVGAVGSGSFQMQSPAAFDLGTGHFQGPYLMRLDGVYTPPGSSPARAAIIGLFNVAPNSSTDITNGTITSGEADDYAGNHSQLSGTVTIDTPSVGHGSADFTITTASGAQTLTTFFYIVDAGHVLVVDYMWSGPLAPLEVPALTGIFRFQETSSGYSTSNALNGPSLFEGLGINSSGHASLIGGTLSVDPANPTTNIAGIYDSNDGGVIPSTTPVTYGGTYTVTSEGRGTLNLTTNSATILNAVFYLRNPGEGFVLEQPVNGSTEGRTGQIAPQTVPSGGFQDSTFNNLTDVGGTETATAASINGLGAVTISGSTSPATYSGLGDASLLGTAPVLGESFSGELDITDSARGRGTLTTTAGSIFGSSISVFYAVDSTTIAVIPQDSTVVEPQLILVRP